VGAFKTTYTTRNYSIISLYKNINFMILKFKVFKKSTLVKSNMIQHLLHHIEILCPLEGGFYMVAILIPKEDKFNTYKFML
jgi:hypothetical protein